MNLNFLDVLKKEWVHDIAGRILFLVSGSTVQSLDWTFFLGNI